MLQLLLTILGPRLRHSSVRNAHAAVISAIVIAAFALITLRLLANEASPVLAVNLPNPRLSPHISTPDPFQVGGLLVSTTGTPMAGVAMTFSRVSGSGAVPAPVQTGASGTWSQSGFRGGTTYRVTPSKLGFVFTPASRDFNGPLNTLNFQYTSDPFTVGGRVITTVGAPVIGVTITFSRISGNGAIPPPVQTDSNGYWSQTGFRVGTTYRATSRYVGYRFNPTARDFFDGAINDLNFQHTNSIPNPKSITGRVVTTVGAPVGGVTISFLLVSGTGVAPPPVPTDSNGYWGQSGFQANALYQVVPGNPGFIFSPATNNVLAPKTDVKFYAIPDPFTVAGRVVTAVGAPISGTTITFSRISGNGAIPPPVQTDSNGHWGQTGFRAGSAYKASPSKTGIVFLPPSLDFIKAINDLNFVGKSAGTQTFTAIGSLQASPDAIFSNEATAVTITAQVAVDPKLLPASINLIRVRNPGNVIETVGRLYDDGTHGDVLIGDGTFTGKFSFNESVIGDISLAVTAAYQGNPQPVSSSIFIVNVLRRPSNAELQTTIQVQQNAAHLFETMRAQMGDANARTSLVALLRQQPGVAEAGISQDGQTIWIKYAIGGNGIIIGNQRGTRGASQNKAISRTPLGMGLPFLSLPTNNTQLTGNGRAIVLAAFFDQFSPTDESDIIAQKLSQTCAGPVSPLKNQSVTVNTMKTLNQYGVISISTHGGVDGNGDVAILTREEDTLLNKLSHLADWLTGRIESMSVDSGTYFAITPAFIRHYSGGGYPQSLIYASACHTLDNSTLANAFLDNGASSFYGWQNSVNSNFAFQTGISLFNILANTDLDAAERTTGKAFNSLGNITDPMPPNAVFTIAGSKDLAILDNPITNGGFESGDLSGWVRDSTPGYSKASIDDHTAGNYAARIGRWDQPYMQGGCFRCAQVQGAEPSGQDFIYQDVSLPSDAATLTLKFDYNVVTYDGANYDWFDMKVLDASTGAVLMQPVNHIGGIISGCTCNWGLFYTTGWQHVSVDLTAYKGRKVRLFFGTTQDGFGDQIATYIDQVVINCK